MGPATRLLPRHPPSRFLQVQKPGFFSGPSRDTCTSTGSVFAIAIIWGFVQPWAGRRRRKQVLSTMTPEAWSRRRLAGACENRALCARASAHDLSGSCPRRAASSILTHSRRQSVGESVSGSVSGSMNRSASQSVNDHSVSH